MNRKQFSILFLLSLIPFSLYALLRDTFIGADTYGYLSFACQTTQQIGLSENLITIGSQLFFTNIPCLFPVIVFFEWLLFFSCILVLSFTGELFD